MRYTSVRRQTAPRPGEPELQVLDYQNVALDLLPMVASAYALIFMVSLLLSPPRPGSLHLDEGPPCRISMHQRASDFIPCSLQVVFE